MLLTMDVGHSNIKVGLFEGETLISSFRITTNADRSSDEYGLLIIHFLTYLNRKAEEIEGVIIATVQPQLRYTLDRMTHTFFHCRPMFVSYQLNLGLKIQYDSLPALGADRIANAVAVQAEYGGPCIFIDFGTATTFGAIDEEGSFLGGCICPGLKLTSDALVRGTAKLPRFELVRPEHVISRTTVTNLQSGVINGFIGQIEYLVRKFREELHAPEALVVATGGMAVIVAEEGGIIDKLDGILTLKGLRLLYERNR